MWCSCVVVARISGAAMQGYTRNPLADPGVLGVSGMAAFGAVMTLYIGAANTTPEVPSAAETSPSLTSPAPPAEAA